MSKPSKNNALLVSFIYHYIKMKNKIAIVLTTLFLSAWFSFAACSPGDTCTQECCEAFWATWENGSCYDESISCPREWEQCYDLGSCDLPDVVVEGCPGECWNANVDPYECNVSGGCYCPIDCTIGNNTCGNGICEPWENLPYAHNYCEADTQYCAFFQDNEETEQTLEEALINCETAPNSVECCEAAMKTVRDADREQFNEEYNAAFQEFLATQATLSSEERAAQIAVFQTQMEQFNALNAAMIDQHSLACEQQFWPCKEDGVCNDSAACEWWLLDLDCENEELCDWLDNDGDGIVDNGPDEDGDWISDCYQHLCNAQWLQDVITNCLEWIDSLPTAGVVNYEDQSVYYYEDWNNIDCRNKYPELFDKAIHKISDYPWTRIITLLWDFNNVSIEKIIDLISLYEEWNLNLIVREDGTYAFESKSVASINILFQNILINRPGVIDYFKYKFLNEDDKSLIDIMKENYCDGSNCDTTTLLENLFDWDSCELIDYILILKDAQVPSWDQLPLIAAEWNQTLDIIRDSIAWLVGSLERYEKVCLTQCISSNLIDYDNEWLAEYHTWVNPKYFDDVYRNNTTASIVWEWLGVCENFSDISIIVWDMLWIGITQEEVFQDGVWHSVSSVVWDNWNKYLFEPQDDHCILIDLWNSNSLTNDNDWTTRSSTGTLWWTKTTKKPKDPSILIKWPWGTTRNPKDPPTIWTTLPKSPSGWWTEFGTQSVDWEFEVQQAEADSKSIRNNTMKYLRILGVLFLGVVLFIAYKRKNKN